MGLRRDDQSLDPYMVLVCTVNVLSKYLFNTSMNEYTRLCLLGEVFHNFYQIESPWGLTPSNN